MRIDTIEQGLRDLCNFEVQGEGYRLSYRVASDNLRLGKNVVSDSCNPIDTTRKEWEDVAKESDCIFINIEIVCSNREEHKRRVKERKNEVENLKLPTWEDVKNRNYHLWVGKRVMIDTANKSIDECFNELNSEIKQYLEQEKHQIVSQF